MGRARANIYLKNYEEAVWDLQTVVEMPNEDLNAYTLYQTYESLALALSQNGKNDKAEEVLRDARKRLPIYHAALTEKLAIVLYQQNRKTEALKELEDAQTAGAARNSAGIEKCFYAARNALRRNRTKGKITRGFSGIFECHKRHK